MAQCEQRLVAAAVGAIFPVRHGGGRGERKFRDGYRGRRFRRGKHHQLEQQQRDGARRNPSSHGTARAAESSAGTAVDSGAGESRPAGRNAACDTPSREHPGAGDTAAAFNSPAAKLSETGESAYDPIITRV
jgi:hypothetical protein